jgi:hypothetical protein
MTQIWVLRSRLEKQPTDLRQSSSYFGDRTLELLAERSRSYGGEFSVAYFARHFLKIIARETRKKRREKYRRE